MVICDLKSFTLSLPWWVSSSSKHLHLSVTFYKVRGAVKVLKSTGVVRGCTAVPSLLAWVLFDENSWVPRMQFRHSDSSLVETIPISILQQGQIWHGSQQGTNAIARYHQFSHDSGSWKLKLFLAHVQARHKDEEADQALNFSLLRLQSKLNWNFCIKCQPLNPHCKLESLIFLKGKKKLSCS